MVIVEANFAPPQATFLVARLVDTDLAGMNRALHQQPHHHLAESGGQAKDLAIEIAAFAEGRAIAVGAEAVGHVIARFDGHFERLVIGSTVKGRLDQSATCHRTST